MIECIQNIEINYNESDSIEPILQLMERYFFASFGSMGAMLHFIEKLYKKEYEEKLITLLKRTPRVHIVWNLNSVINEDDNIKWTKTDF